MTLYNNPFYKYKRYTNIYFIYIYVLWFLWFWTSRKRHLLPCTLDRERASKAPLRPSGFTTGRQAMSTIHATMKAAIRPRTTKRAYQYLPRCHNELGDKFFPGKSAMFFSDVNRKCCRHLGNRWLNRKKPFTGKDVCWRITYLRKAGMMPPVVIKCAKFYLGCLDTLPETFNSLIPSKATLNLCQLHSQKR